MRNYLRSINSNFLLGALLALAVLFWLGANGLQTSVSRVDDIARPSLPDSTTFRIVSSDGADTSQYFKPWTYASVCFVAHGDSVDALASFEVGTKKGDNYILSVEDTYTISAAGDHVTMLYVPVCDRARIVFSAGSSNGATTTIDSMVLLRQW